MITINNRSKRLANQSSVNKVVLDIVIILTCYFLLLFRAARVFGLSKCWRTFGSLYSLGERVWYGELPGHVDVVDIY